MLCADDREAVVRQAIVETFMGLWQLVETRKSAVGGCDRPCPQDRRIAVGIPACEIVVTDAALYGASAPQAHDVRFRRNRLASIPREEL